MSTARWSDRRYLDLAKVVGLSRFDLIRHVVLPQALHAVWTAVGSAFGIAAGLGARSKWTGHIDARPS
jgi:ABC-type nitrate/sulfonate/bicarbonate transport system permease component